MKTSYQRVRFVSHIAAFNYGVIIGYYMPRYSKPDSLESVGLKTDECDGYTIVYYINTDVNGKKIKNSFPTVPYTYNMAKNSVKKYLTELRMSATVSGYDYHFPKPVDEKRFLQKSFDIFGHKMFDEDRRLNDIFFESFEASIFHENHGIDNIKIPNAEDIFKIWEKKKARMQL